MELFDPSTDGNGHNLPSNFGVNAEPTTYAEKNDYLREGKIRMKEEEGKKKEREEKEKNRE